MDLLSLSIVIGFLKCYSQYLDYLTGCGLIKHLYTYQGVCYRLILWNDALSLSYKIFTSQIPLTVLMNSNDFSPLCDPPMINPTLTLSTSTISPMVQPILLGAKPRDRWLSGGLYFMVHSDGSLSGPTRHSSTWVHELSKGFSIRMDPMVQSIRMVQIHGIWYNARGGGVTRAIHPNYLY